MAVEIPPKFMDLWTASTRIGSEVNIIGVVSDYLPGRKSSGPDWTCTFSIADRTLGFIGEVGREGLKARFFKKMRSELPLIWGTGDVVILRNMKIKQFNGVTLAISSYSSTWTVMHASKIPDKVPSNLVQISHDKETRAPTPMLSEMQYVIDVCNYFDKYSYTSKEVSIAVSPSQTENISLTASMVPRQKFSLIKDAQIATYYDLVGQVVKIFPSNNRTDLYITDYTPNQLLYFYEWGQGEDGADARDGDEFGYTSRSSKNTKKWPGPFGKLTLAVTLWSPHSEYAQLHVKEGDFVFLRNTHIRLDQDTKMVGSLHSDRRYADRIDISVLTNFHDDDRVKDVLRRKKDYQKKFDQQSEKYVIEARETKGAESKESNATETEDVKPLSRNQIKKRRRQENQRAQLSRKNPPNNVSAKRKRPDDAANEIVSRSCDTATHHTPASSLPSQKAPKFDSKLILNENIKCSHHLTPTTPLSTILSLDAHTNKTPNGESYTLPFQNINSRASVRVVDFWPSRLEDFASLKRKRSEYAVLSDYEDSDSECESHEEDMPLNAQAFARQEKCDSGNNKNGRSESEEQEWEWRFALLLEDVTEICSSPESKPTLKAYIYGPDAECLLKLDAENLHASPTALAALREKLFLLWGDLEERKMKIQEGEKSTLKEVDPNGQIIGRNKREEAKGRPFQCCLKEYGVKVRKEGKEVDRRSGNANGGDESEQEESIWRWERRWRMWGCTII